MDYTVRFSRKEPIVRDTLVNYFRSRPGYRIDGKTIAYESSDTGVSFYFELDDALDTITLHVAYRRAPIFGLEAAIEAGALVASFGFDVSIPSADATRVGRYSPEDFVREYAQGNALAHKTLLDLGFDHHELPSAVLTAAWRWNLQRTALERLHGEQTFVPRVVCALHPETGHTCTASIWPASMPIVLPLVDILILTDNTDRTVWVTTRDVVHLLDRVGIRSPRHFYSFDGHLKEAGLAHYDLSKDTEIFPEILACARRQGEPPKILPMVTVLSRELTRVALGIADATRELKKRESTSPFPRECQGFVRTRAYELTHVLGGYTWLSPWKIESIAFSSGGNVIAGVGAGGVVFFDARSGKRIREVHGDVYAGTSVGISGDGKTLAIGDELGNVNVFDVDLTTSEHTLMKRCAYGISDCEAVDEKSSPPHGYVIGVSTDGSTVVGGAGDYVFVLREGEEPASFEVRGAVCASRDLAHVWTGTAIRDLTTGEEKLRLEIDPRNVRVPALSPDGRHLAFATTSGALQVVRLEDGAVLAFVSKKDARGQPAVARFIAYMPGGTKLVVGDSASLEVRSATTLEREKVFDSPVWDAAISDTTIYRAAEDRIWTQPLDGPAPPVNDGPITQLFHSTRGPIAIACSAPGPGDSMTGGRAVLWHVPSGEVLRATDRLCPERINLSPDGRLLCLATDTALRVLDVGTLEAVAVVEPLGNERFVRPLDLDASPDGEHVLACMDGGLARMICLRTGEDRWRADLGIRCATFTPDGRQIVAGDASRLRVLDSMTGSIEKEVAIDDPRDDGEHVLLGGPTRAARVVPGEGIAVIDLETGTSDIQVFPTAREVLASSPDGRVVALTVEGEASSGDLVLWSVEAREEVDRIRLESAEDTPASVAFSPDGSKLLVGTSRGALLVFSRK